MSTLQRWTVGRHADGTIQSRAHAGVLVDEDRPLPLGERQRAGQAWQGHWRQGRCRGNFTIHTCSSGVQSAIKCVVAVDGVTVSQVHTSSAKPCTVCDPPDLRRKGGRGAQILGMVTPSVPKEPMRSLSLVPLGLLKSCSRDPRVCTFAEGHACAQNGTTVDQKWGRNTGFTRISGR